MGTGNVRPPPPPGFDTVEPVGNTPPPPPGFDFVEPSPVGPKIGAREPRSLIDQARDYVAGLASERRIGAGEREEAKAAGIGVTMTPGELAMAASAPALPIAAAAALPATLGGMLAGHFGSIAGGKLGAEAAESFAPGAGSLGEEAGALAGGLAGGAAGVKAPGAIASGAAAIRAAAPEFAASRVGSMVRGAAPLAVDLALDAVPMGRTARMLFNLARAGLRNRNVAVPAAVEAAAPAIAETAAAAPAVAEAVAAPAAAEAAPVPAWVQKIAERAKANPLKPSTAPVAEVAAAEATPAVGEAVAAAPSPPAYETADPARLGPFRLPKEPNPNIWRVSPAPEILPGQKVSTARLSPEQLAEFQTAQPVEIAGAGGASSQSRTLMDLARKSGAEPGDRVWFLIEDGKPRAITSGQAAAAKRAGKTTTWVEVPR